ncbi:RNA polymerase sigma factor [Fusibacter sp. JL298sf-3]
MSEEKVSAQFNTYLKRSLVGARKNYLRRHWRAAEDIPVDPLEIDVAMPSFEDGLLDSLAFAHEQKALDATCYNVLNAYYILGYTDVEIGRVLGITKQAAYKRRQKALSLYSAYVAQRRSST